MRRLAVRATAGVLALLVTGCGGGSSAGTPVASLPATGGARVGGQHASAGSSPTGLEGPTLPVNASVAEIKRIVNPYFQCLQAHGDPNIGSKPNGIMGPNSSTVTPAISAAQAACRSLLPHGPWQEMPQYNPHYNQDMAAWVNCLNAHGIHVHQTSDGWTYDSSGPLPPGSGQTTVRCEMKAFGEH